MTAPITLHQISGRVRDSLGALVVGATVTVTHSSIEPVLPETTNSSGEYIINLDGLSSQWAKGDSISITATKARTPTSLRETVTTADTIKGTGGQTIDLNLVIDETSELVFAVNTQDRYNLNFSLITTFDGEKVTHSNPLPVDISSRAITNTVIGNKTFLDTLPANNMLEIARGNVSGMTFIHKFGEAPDFDTGDNFVDIWDGAADGAAVDQNLYQYSTTDDIDSLSSSVDTDTQQIEVQGLDANFTLVTQIITITGQTTKALDTNLMRIFRMKNVGSTTLAGTVYCYVSGGTVTAGVPVTDADVRAIISLHGTISHNQTLMALYTIPAGKIGYLCQFYASSIGAVKTAIKEIHLEVRPFGKVFQTKHTSSLTDVGTSQFAHRFDIPEVTPAKSDVRIQADTDVSSAGVSAGFDIILVDA